MQDLEASDGVATINANTTITATRMGSPRLQSDPARCPRPNITHGLNF
jgi:hypothetical protein